MRDDTDAILVNVARSDHPGGVRGLRASASCLPRSQYRPQARDGATGPGTAFAPAEAARAFFNLYCGFLSIPSWVVLSFMPFLISVLHAARICALVEPSFFALMRDMQSFII